MELFHHPRALPHVSVLSVYSLYPPRPFWLLFWLLSFMVTTPFLPLTWPLPPPFTSRYSHCVQVSNSVTAVLSLSPGLWVTELFKDAGVLPPISFSRLWWKVCLLDPLWVGLKWQIHSNLLPSALNKNKASIFSSLPVDHPLVQNSASQPASQTVKVLLIP